MEASASWQRTLTIIEVGSNNGAWMDRRMTRYKKEGHPSGLPIRCFMFEPQPFFSGGDGPAKTTAEKHNCTIYPTAVWTEVADFEFVSNANNEASSLLSGGFFDSNSSVRFKVRSVSIVDFFLQHVSPYDHVIFKLDVEGAEYAILQRLITVGFGCWLNEAILEFHATHNPRNYNNRPMDVAFSWMLRQCNVR